MAQAKNTYEPPFPWASSPATMSTALAAMRKEQATTPNKAPDDGREAPLGGKVGILSGLALDESRTKRELAAQRAAEQEVQSICDEIDAMLVPHLKPELERENARARISVAVKKDFERFKAVCSEWGLPALPAKPHSVAVFLADMQVNPAEVPKLARSISVVHRACGFYDDPTNDVLVRAIIAKARESTNKPPQTKEG